MYRNRTAIVRARSDEPADTISWILVVAKGTAEDRPILEVATRETKLAPVLIVGPREDVESEAGQDEYVQLAVIGESETGKSPAIHGPHDRRRFRHAQSPVLVVRP